MSIDWSKAPDGATHYAPKLEENDFWCSVFWRMENGVGVEAWSIDNRTGELHHFNRPTWIETTAKRLVPRPAACAHASTTWDGQGLPPVGTVCEYRHMIWPEYRPCEIRYISEESLVAYDNGQEQFYRTCDMLFRPVRTLEQIAAEEREAGISDMQTITYGAGPTVYAKLSALYDAGYRRQEEGK